MIPFIDLKAQYRSIKDELEAAVLKVLASTQYSLGSEVAAFEEEFAAFCNTEYAVAVNSGTSALHLALIAAGVERGDEVITVASTFVATVAAIDYVGARPVFVDIEPGTLNIDAALIESRITERTKAIVPVHLHGHPSDMDPVLEIARRRGLRVIEDAAQAHDSEYKGRRVGGIGDIGCFSFYPGKNLGACGEGGIVVTNNAEYAEKIRMLRDWGQSSKYHHDFKGFNYRMDGIQGAVLRVKLRHLKDWTEARRRNASIYDELLSGVGVVTPVEEPYARHVYHVYAIRTPQRDALQQVLKQRDIHTGIHYPIPVHLQKAYAEFGYEPGSLPVTETAASELLSLPLFAELGQGQIRQVSDTIREMLNAI
ncbi:DegT/DnrJ/EryC1/StrS family aminotransferase [Gammaproteobacteria bacterium]|nr:DegT/DnrJ/EryC1/StrS family aminotransferase [Gammaproteobacteria bacterium]